MPTDTTTGTSTVTESPRQRRRSEPSTINSQPSTNYSVALLTGGGDKPYALGMATALTADGNRVDFIGSNEQDDPELRSNPRVRFLNLRGDQRADAGPMSKMLRVLKYYLKLIGYAATSKAKIFHILWNNKFELFDRTLLMLYYRLLGKRVVLTVHNVNIRKRDDNDSWLNRFSLKTQYGLCHHMFVHTEKMKGELLTEFGVPESRVSVIPFGINNTVPNTTLTSAEAKRKLGVNDSDKTILFFGNIAPYKGLEYLVAAFTELVKRDGNYRLIIAGRLKCDDDYWGRIQQAIKQDGVNARIIQRIEFVPDEQTEIYFKAADVLVLPYTLVFQSGVLSLGYSFGLPVIAADVGSLKEDVVEGRTGFVFRSQDSMDLAEKISLYFNGEMFKELGCRRAGIQEYANERYSWDKVATITGEIYSKLLKS